jgi:hypothetical protein
MKTTFRTRLAALAATTITRGVRRSDTPRREALARQGYQRERQAERPDAEIEDGEVAGPPLSSHQVHERHRQADQQGGEHDADPAREPQRLRSQAPRLLVLGGAGQARHLRGGAVGEEVEERERADDQRAGDGERGQLLGAKVSDHGGVGEQVERLGRERSEGGQGEPEDLPVVGRAKAAHSSTK